MDQQLAGIEAVAAGDIHRVARRLLDPAHPGCTASGVKKRDGIREKDLAAQPGKNGRAFADMLSPWPF